MLCLIFDKSRHFPGCFHTVLLTVYRELQRDLYLVTRLKKYKGTYIYPSLASLILNYDHFQYYFCDHLFYASTSCLTYISIEKCLVRNHVDRNTDIESLLPCSVVRCIWVRPLVVLQCCFICLRLIRDRASVNWGRLIKLIHAFQQETEAESRFRSEIKEKYLCWSEWQKRC